MKCQVFILAIKILSKKYQIDDVNLHFYGDGIRKELNKKIVGERFSSRIFFHGAVASNYCKYHGKDLVLLSTHTEGIPNIIFEAAQFGLPVIVSNVGGVGEIIQHDKNGLLVDRNSPYALAEAISKVIRDNELPQRLVTELKKLIGLEYSEHQANFLLKVYKDAKKKWDR